MVGTAVADVAVGSVMDVGVAAVFGPGTNIPHAAQEILDLIKAASKT